MAITDSTSRKLWMLSGNECAFKLCTTRLFNEYGAYVAERAHIVSEKPNGPRGGEQLPAGAEGYDDFENIILLCEPHHKTIDTFVTEFPVERLVEWKREHEDRFRDVVNEIRNSIASAQQMASTFPTKDASTLWPRHGAFEFRHDSPFLKQLQQRLSGLTPSSRNILAIMLTHAIPDSTSLRLDIVEAGRIFLVPPEKVRHYIKPLESHNFVVIDEEQNDITFLDVSPEHWGHAFWFDLREMHDRLPTLDAIVRVIERGDFAVLGK